MNILLGITYYYPNISGLSLYAQNLAEGMAQRGHEVTVLTSRHLETLAPEESVNGVKVKRLPVTFRAGKGVIMLSLPWQAFRLIREADVVNCHLPQFESALVVLIAKLLGKRVVLTHHTDLSGWKGLMNRVSEGLVNLSQQVSARFADVIVSYTSDYAEHSRFLARFRGKLECVYPPIKTWPTDSSLQAAISRKAGDARYRIGFAGRIARQKGLPHLLDAIPALQRELGSFKLIFAGPYKEVIGEDLLSELKTTIDRYKEVLVFLGPLSLQEMSSFYSSLDVLVLPSDDRLESFGLVQVEAMLNGCPVVATNLPGARVPVQVTGMGMVVEPGSSAQIAEGIVEVVTNRERYLRPPDEIRSIFDLERTVDAYERLMGVR